MEVKVEAEVEAEVEVKGERNSWTKVEEGRRGSNLYHQTKNLGTCELENS